MAATTCRTVRERPKHRRAALCGSEADTLPPYPQNNFFMIIPGVRKHKTLCGMRERVL